MAIPGFRPSIHLNGLNDPYPAAKVIAEACTLGGTRAINAVADQWLSEGIPYAFKDVPGLYDEIRTWLSLRLDVDKKSISVVGSARLGYSLSPFKLGNPFSEASDLDLFIVSEVLFEKLKVDALKWFDDYDLGKVNPRNDNESAHWKDNRKRVQANLLRGFMDPKFTPTLTSYPVVCSVQQCLYVLSEKLARTEDAPSVSDISIRCYNDWESYRRQCELNLQSLSMSTR